MRAIVVTGGRDIIVPIEERDRFVAYLGRQSPRPVVICGGCRGVDSVLAGEAERHGYHVFRVYALWDRYQAKAGPYRNAEMCKAAKAMDPNATLVYWQGGKGTNDCKATACANGLNLLSIEELP